MTRSGRKPRSRGGALLVGVLMVAFALVDQSTRAEVTFRQAGVDIEGEAVGEFFGGSVTLSADGTRLAIGAKFAGGDPGPGRVRVFDWDNNSWTQTGSSIEGDNSSDMPEAFGSSVALSADGNRLAVGAPANSQDPLSAAGRVSVHDWDGTSWTRAGNNIAGDEDGDLHGEWVALSADGTRLAVGGHQVSIYDWDPSTATWTRAGGNLGDQPRSGSGRPVALSGDGTRLAVGAPFSDDATAVARVYDWDVTTSTWNQFGGTITGRPRPSPGLALSADGALLVVQETGPIPASLQVSTFGLTGTPPSWAILDESLAGDHPGFGNSLALSATANRLAVGAPEGDGASGRIEVFDWNGAPTWTGTDAEIAGGDSFGHSVALSGGGNRIAIGAPTENSDIGITGLVRVYDISTDISPPSTPPTTTAPPQTTIPSPPAGELPATGTGQWNQHLLGAGILLAGGLLIITAARRRAS